MGFQWISTDLMNEWVGFDPQRYVLYLLSSSPWLSTSGTGSTDSGSSGVCLWCSPCCRGRCRSDPYAQFFWRNLYSLHSCTHHSVYLETPEIKRNDFFLDISSFPTWDVTLVTVSETLWPLKHKQNHRVHCTFINKHSHWHHSSIYSSKLYKQHKGTIV